MSNRRLLKQNVTEARRRFCRTLRELASSENEDVVIIHSRGGPLAALISAADALRYFAWKGEEIRRQAGGRGADETGETAEEASTADGPQPLPDGWPRPEKYARQCLADARSPDETVEAVLKHYAPHGMSAEEAGRIVERIFGEEAADR